MFKKKVGRPTNKSKRMKRNIKIIGVVSVIGAFAYIMFSLNNYVETDKIKADANGVTRTATFVTTGTDFVEKTNISCVDKGNGCTIILPKFNRKGHFSTWWSTKPITTESLEGQAFSFSYFYPIGYKYTLKSNVTFYPNFNHFYYSNSNTKNSVKYRNLSISKGYQINNVDFEFESGIPDAAINRFMSFAKTAYSDMSFEYTPTKVFVMTNNTYNNYSTAYGLTHNIYKDSTHNYRSYFTVDLKYDSEGEVTKNAIDENAFLHELAHTWDFFYSYQTGKSIHEQEDVKELFNEMKKRGAIIDAYTSESDGGANIEWFAGMVTNYYWHILGKDTKRQQYALKKIAYVDGKVVKDSDGNPMYSYKNVMTATEKKKWEKIMHKYINATRREEVLTQKVAKRDGSIDLGDENKRLINNKTVTKNLCVENVIYYSGIEREYVKYKTNNSNIKVEKGSNVTLLYKASNSNLKKNAKTILTVYDKKNNKSKGVVTLVNSTDCKNYDIKNAVVSKIPDQAYTTKEVTPIPIVKIGNTVLKKDVDYNLIYSDNKKVGTATIIVRGMGLYSGTKRVNFKITENKTILDDFKQSEDISYATISNISNYIYTGKPIMPQPQVKLSGKILTKGKDYKLTYANNINVGTGKIKIIGIGNYSGEKIVTFTIIKQATQQVGNSGNNNKATSNTPTPSTNASQSQSATGMTQISTIKVTGIAPNNCKSKGVTFTIDSTGDNGATITNIEVSTDSNTWKKSNNCTTGSKKSTCRLNGKYSAIYYKVTTSHNHYQVFGPYCTK